MLEISEVRKRLRHAVDRARRAASARRAQAAAAEQQYEIFLERVAAPVVLLFATALKSEGYQYQVFTPAGVVRLASERAADDFIEIALDGARQPPAVVGRVSLGRGRRVVTAERALGEDRDIAALTDEDVLQFLLAEIAPFVER